MAYVPPSKFNLTSPIDNYVNFVTHIGHGECVYCEYMNLFNYAYYYITECVLYIVILLSLYANIEHELCIISNSYIASTNINLYTTHLITHNSYLSSNQSSILKVRGECNVMYEYIFTFIL